MDFTGTNSSVELHRPSHKNRYPIERIVCRDYHGAFDCDPKSWAVKIVRRNRQAELAGPLSSVQLAAQMVSNYARERT